MNDVSSDVQKANFAGIFYPSDRDELRTLISAAIDASPRVFPRFPKFVIAPHSGIQYTSSATASAYRELANPAIKRVVILSPSHRVKFEGVAAPAHKKFETPLGNLNLEQRGFNLASRLKFVKVNQDVFDQEHGAEVHFPWIKYQIPSTRILPLIIGRTSEEDMAKLLQALWGNIATAFVVSSDLSHFHSLQSANQIDSNTAQAIERLDADGIQHTSACGSNIIRPILKRGKSLRMRVTRTALTTSFEQTNDDQLVVGYGAWAGHALANSSVNSSDQLKLYNACAKAVSSNFKTGKDDRQLETTDLTHLNSFLSCFVTLKIDNVTHGSMGGLNANAPLYQAVQENAIKAAFEDNRFEPLSEEKFDQLEAEISVLGRPLPMNFDNRDEVLEKLSGKLLGVTIAYSMNRATFLPNLWDEYDDPDQFLKALVLKAGLPPGFWSEDISIQTYRAELFDKMLLKDAL